MVQGYKFVLYYLWIAPHALLIAVAGVMFARRLHKIFPIFFAYTLYEIFEFLLLFLCYRVGHGLGILYRWVFIGTLAISTALRFGIIQEIFNNLFRDYPRLEKLAIVSTRWIAGLLFVAALLAAFYSSGNTSDNVMVGVRLLEQSVTIIQVGLLLFLFLFTRMFGLSWRSYTFGVAIGFAVFASAQLAEWALSLRPLSESSKDLLDLLPTGSYHVAVVVWLGYLLVAEKPARVAISAVPEIDRWSGELERSR